MLSVHSDEHFMKEAIRQAEIAYEKGEVPVGAVIVADNRIIARAHNQTEQLNDATAHAEMLVITAAENHLGTKYLNECTLFVTLEPCVMCAGALYWAQLGKVVFAAQDEKRGYSLHEKNLLHPKTKVEKGKMEKEASKLLKDFFKNVRID
ncbi:MAG: nucleoside deaminase [Cyclobacteriaceae bacterium]|nr:nucleoside deaminase [Cyclobacteriaceae bacterium]